MESEERGRRWSIVLIIERASLSSHERRVMHLPSIYRFFFSFFPSLFQVCRKQSSLYVKSLPWPTSLQRNIKVSERFLVLSMYKIAIPSRNSSTNFQRPYLPCFSSDYIILGSMDIYSKRAFQRWVDCTDPMVGLRVMSILILLSLKNPKIIVHIWKLLISSAMGCVGPMRTSKEILGSFFPCFLTLLPSLVCFQAFLIF